MKLAHLQEAKYQSGNLIDWVIQTVNEIERGARKVPQGPAPKRFLDDEQYKDAIQQLTDALGKPKRNFVVREPDKEWHWHLTEINNKRFNYMIRLKYFATRQQHHIQVEAYVRDTPETLGYT